MERNSYPEIHIPLYILELLKGNIREPKEPNKPKEPYKVHPPTFSPIVFLFLLGGVIFMTFQVIIGIVLILIFILATIMYFSDKANYPLPLSSNN